MSSWLTIAEFHSLLADPSRIDEPLFCIPISSSAPSPRTERGLRIGGEAPPNDETCCVVVFEAEGVLLLNYVTGGLRDNNDQSGHDRIFHLRVSFDWAVTVSLLANAASRCATKAAAFM